MLVLVEKTDAGYRASSGKPLEAESVGATREEALTRLRELIEGRLQGEVEVVDLAIPGEPRREQNPYLQLFGALQNDPSFEEWQATITETRRAENESAGIFPERNS